MNRGKRKRSWYKPVFSPFLAMFSTLPKRNFKMKEFADHSFKFDKNGRKFSKSVENTEGKGEIAC